MHYKFFSVTIIIVSTNKNPKPPTVLDTEYESSILFGDVEHYDKNVQFEV